MDYKNANVLRKEYRVALSNLEIVKTRIKFRTHTLVKQYPDILVGDLPAQEVLDAMLLYLDTNDNPDDAFVSSKLLLIIEVLEDHIASQHPHVQTTLYPKS